MPPPSSTSPAPSWLTDLGWSDRFELLERIGSGGMGQVWRARERGTDRIVALKTLDPSKSGDDHLLARLDIEAATLIKLRDAGQHEHIVPIIDFKVSDAHACLVMEFIPGLNLRKWCDTHQLSLTKRVELITQVARATGWFHALDVIHRDLKPANILVSAVTHQPVIVDFSIAKINDTLPLTLTNEALGTAPYMAPEQLDRTRGDITPATDVYALGVTLYELLTHILPHPGELPQIIQRHQNEVAPARPSLINKDVPRDLESICLKALSHRPIDRYASGTELADDLDHFLAGEPVTARPLSTMAHLVRQAQRKPALTIALAACLLLALLAGWGILRAGNERHQREIEARLTAAYRQEGWTRSSLQAAEAEIALLAVDDPALAARHSTLLCADVAGDFENTLRRGDFKSSQLEWLRDAALPWLRSQKHPQAAAFDQLLAERLGRWETRAQIAAPFDDLQGLFPRSRLQVRDGLLHTRTETGLAADLEGDAPQIRVLDDARSPIEVSMTFQADAAKFRRLRVSHQCQSLRLDVYLFKLAHAPSAVRALLPDLSNLDPKGYVLFSSRDRSRTFDQATYIPDSSVLIRGCTLTTRIEDRRLTVDLDGRWSTSIEDLFAFTSAAGSNSMDLYWPPSLGLRQMIVRTRSAGGAGPMEQADVLFSQDAFRDAQRLYESLLSDPALSAEASYKLARCLGKQGDSAAAHSLWEKISQGSPSAWQQLSTYPLWLTAARTGGPTAARPYLARLPQREDIAPQLKATISSKDQSVILKAYRSVGHGLNALRRDVTALNEAAKAFAIMAISSPETAVSLALPLHFGGLDDLSRRMLNDGLKSPGIWTKDKTCQDVAGVALEHWTRISRSEKTADLRRALAGWSEAYPQNPTYRAIAQQEDGRVLARTGKLSQALNVAQEAHGNSKADARILTAGWLLEGMIRQELGQPAEAQIAWQQATQTDVDAEGRSALHLTDLILLHTAARTWTRETCTQVITEIMGRGKTSSTANTARSLFISQFMIGDEFIRSLNGIAERPQGHQFLKNAIFRRITAREAVTHIYRLIMSSYFVSTAFTQPTAEQAARVDQLTEHLTEAIATLPEGEASLHLYFQTWATVPAALDPAMFQPDPRFATLNAELKWLLAQRYTHLGKSFIADQ